MRAAKTDANQTEIVAALRKIGASVAITSSVGNGFPDIVCGLGKINFMFECKDGKKVPSARRLTPDQVKFHANWNGAVHVVNSAEEAIQIILKAAE
jgi:Holliday junction resolvase